MLWPAAFFLLLGLTGLFLQGALEGRGWKPDGEALAASPLFGAALLGSVLVLGLVFFDRFLSGAALLLPAGLGAAWAVRARRFPGSPRPSPPQPRGPGIPRRTGRLLLAVLLGFAFLLAALAYKDGAPGDYLSIWGFKALVLSKTETLRIPIFRDWRAYHAHQDYPLLFPALQALLYRAAGTVLDRSAKMLYPLLLAAAAAGLFFHLLYRRGRTAALAAGLFCLATPGLCGFHPGICSAYMDVPLGLFLLFTALHGTAWLETGRAADAARAGLCLAGACLTKNEGIAYAVPVVLCFLAAALRSPRGRMKSLSVLLLPALVAGGTWFLFRRQLPAGNSDYAALFTSRIFLEKIAGLPEVCGRYLLELVHFERWGFLWILLAATAPRWFRRGGGPAGACLAAVLLLQVAAVTVSPLGIPYQTASALPRLAGQIAPLAAWLTGLALTREGGGVSALAPSPCRAVD